MCHAWDDRKNAATELHDHLESKGVSVWFSEKDVALGTSLLREIDKGLAKSRVGIVLVTPALLNRLKGEGIADKELSALLARDLLIPIVHNTSYEDSRSLAHYLVLEVDLVLLKTRWKLLLLNSLNWFLFLTPFDLVSHPLGCQHRFKKCRFSAVSRCWILPASVEKQRGYFSFSPDDQRGSSGVFFLERCSRSSL